MPEMHLRQPEFTYSAGGPFTKNKERIKKFKETQDSRHIYQNELDKACFPYDIAYEDFKDLTRKTVPIKYQRGLFSMAYKFFNKKLLAEQLKIRICLIKN